MFAYCLNNPINGIDPSGLCALCLTAPNSDQFSATGFDDCRGGGAGNGTGRSVSARTDIAVGSVITTLLPLAGAALASAASEVYAYAHSLVDLSASMYENHQPRVHHVIPVGDFSRYGEDTTRKLIEMRELLATVDMTVNHPENLIVMSHGSHKSLHTKDYIDSIYAIMMTARAGNKESVRWALFLARTYASSLDQYPLGY